MIIVEPVFGSMKEDNPLPIACMMDVGVVTIVYKIIGLSRKSSNGEESDTMNRERFENKFLRKKNIVDAK